ncbi:AAA-like domain-containing protein [Prochlorothrix hollandica]|uniref:AAA-like domain-containing protein n=1 Tax=Prochlorothrix hollandica TaxID=1223 RepID=UPI003342E168
MDARDRDGPDRDGREADFTWGQARDFANQLIQAHSGKHLTDLEIKVLQGSWQNHTYEAMAEQYTYGAGYLNRDVGNALWKKLSQALGEKVSKTNFREALRRAWWQQGRSVPSVPPSVLPMTPPLPAVPLAETPFAEGPVAPQSPFYVVRSQVEDLGLRSLLKPGALVRVKAPSLMGKTSFLYYLLQGVQLQGYATIYLDLGSIDRDILTDLGKLLRWLCARVSRQLKIPNRLEEFWDSDIFGSNDNCTAYFEEYLLQEVPQPVVLGLDNVDRLFPHGAVVEDFFGLLRSWHERARISMLWQQLRLVLMHSTDVYIPLDYNQSPFNTGVPIELVEFSPDQIQALALLHHCSLDRPALAQLMAAIGGHPYLVRRALYELGTGSQTLGQLLATAATETGIYGAHLRRQWLLLQQNPALWQALIQVVQGTEPVSLSPLTLYKLHSMGLIHRHNNRVMPRCTVYRDYFRSMHRADSP